MSVINPKVSPDLKRYIPGQKNNLNLKNIKKENEEKEEEENKTKDNNRIHSQNLIGNINLKNITSLKENQTIINNNIPSIDNNLNNRITIEKELDKIFEKLIISVRERKSFDKNLINLNFENVFKSNLDIVNVNCINLTNLKNENSNYSGSNTFVDNLITSSEFCLNGKNKSPDQDYSTDLRENIEIKFIGKKRLPESLEKIDCDKKLEKNNFSQIPNGNLKNIFKTQKLDDTSINSIQNNTNTNQSNTNTNQNKQNNLSIFDRFFITFKSSYYITHKVDATISDDKREFVFKYQRILTKEKVLYKIIYNHEIRKIILLQKIINDELLKEVNNENGSEVVLNELRGMLEDISKNVEKKIN